LLLIDVVANDPICSAAAGRWGGLPFAVTTSPTKMDSYATPANAPGLWDSFGLSKYTFGSGSFSQNVRGRWYADICVEVRLLWASILA